MKIVCPSCGVAYQVPEALLAKRQMLKCSACGVKWRVQIPQPQPEPVAEPVPHEHAQPQSALPEAAAPHRAVEETVEEKVAPAPASSESPIADKLDSGPLPAAEALAPQAPAPEPVAEETPKQPAPLEPQAPAAPVQLQPEPQPVPPPAEPAPEVPSAPAVEPEPEVEPEQPPEPEELVAPQPVLEVPQPTTVRQVHVTQTPPPYVQPHVEPTLSSVTKPFAPSGPVAAPEPPQPKEAATQTGQRSEPLRRASSPAATPSAPQVGAANTPRPMGMPKVRPEVAQAYAQSAAAHVAQPKAQLARQLDVRGLILTEEFWKIAWIVSVLLAVIGFVAIWHWWNAIVHAWPAAARLHRAG